VKQLTAWVFAGADTAQQAEAALAALSARAPVALDDGAQLWWPGRRRRPSYRGIENIALGAALGTSFWGLLFGTLFVVPTLGTLSHLDPDALDELLSGVGITSGFLHQLRHAVMPDSSALLVLAEVEALDRVDAAFARWQPQRADALLPADHHRDLRATFSR
jgi:uncharacterized membrane protein